MTTEEQFWAAVNWLKTVPDPRAKLLASQAALVGDMREALWICVEHNALHFGERHNTVVQGRAALAGAAPAAQGDALDAERYRWLRERWGHLCESYEDDSGRIVGKMRCDAVEGWDVDPASLDAAIDAARGAQGESNEPV